MPVKSFKVDINPAVLRWARQSTGWKVEEIASSLEVSKERVEKWERGEDSPTIKQLKKIAHSVKRPLAAFLLSEPPEELRPPRDFRTISKGRGKFSKQSLLALRTARGLQTVAQELMEELNIKPKIEVGTASSRDNFEEVATRERRRLGIDIETQISWQDAYRALEEWRKTLEHFNILTFQFRIPIEEARGLSLLDGGPAIIIVSSYDNINARTFTLFHEYAHILIGQEGICNSEEELLRGRRKNAIERWTDRFAGALILPEEIVRGEKEFEYIAKCPKPRVLLKELSEKFKVSMHSILVRLSVLDIITGAEYDKCFETIKAPRGIRDKQQKVRIKSYPRRCIDARGRLFTSLVMEGAEKRLITYNDVADYLDIRLKHLGAVQSLLKKA